MLGGIDDSIKKAYEALANATTITSSTAANGIGGTGQLGWWGGNTTWTTTTVPIPGTIYANPLWQQQMLPTQTYGAGYVPNVPVPPLSPKHAEDMIMQFEHDGIIVKDGKLLFGSHVAKSLRTVPIEYIAALGMAVKGLRRALINEVRRRRVVERLPKQ